MERDDQELSLFRELRKRQNEHNIPSLLLCASEEYEYCDTNINATATGRFSLYRIPSGKKEYGLEFLETNKSDYDWLKTPPATPLFPSLEMEPSAQLVIQKEIPITQPISRFAKSEVDALKPKVTIDGKANHTNPTKAKIPMRSKTPSHNRQRPTIIKNNTNEQQSGTNSSTTTHPATTTNQSSSSNTKTEHDVAATNTKHSTPHKQTNNAALNPKKSIIEANESQKKPRARSVNVILELPKEAPPNLRTSSTTRGRSTSRASTTLVGHHQKQDPTPKACCRPSRSPSPSMSNSSGGGCNQLDRTQRNLRTQQKDAFTLAAGSNESRSSSFFKGSKMVEKVLNARKSGMNQADRETKLVKPIKYR